MRQLGEPASAHDEAKEDPAALLRALAQTLYEDHWRRTVVEGLAWPFSADDVAALMDTHGARVQWDRSATGKAAEALNHGARLSREGAFALADRLKARADARRGKKTLIRAGGGKGLVAAVVESNRRGGGSKPVRAVMFAELNHPKRGRRFLEAWRGAMHLGAFPVKGRDPDEVKASFVRLAAEAWRDLCGVLPRRRMGKTEQATPPFEAFCVAARDHLLAQHSLLVPHPERAMAADCLAWLAALRSMTPLGVAGILRALPKPASPQLSAKHRKLNA